MNIEKVPSRPTDSDFVVYDEVWGVLNGSPELDEEVIVDGIAEAKGVTKEELDQVLFGVEEYKIFVNERLFNGAAMNVSGSIKEYNYEPTTDTVSIKLGYQRERYSMAVAIRDCTALSRHVFHNMFCVKTLVVGFYDHEGLRIAEKEYTNRIK